MEGSVVAVLNVTFAFSVRSPRGCAGLNLDDLYQRFTTSSFNEEDGTLFASLSNGISMTVHHDGSVVVMYDASLGSTKDVHRYLTILLRGLIPRCICSKYTVLDISGKIEQADDKPWVPLSYWDECAQHCPLPGLVLSRHPFELVYLSSRGVSYQITFGGQIMFEWANSVNTVEEDWSDEVGPFVTTLRELGAQCIPISPLSGKSHRIHPADSHHYSHHSTDSGV